MEKDCLTCQNFESFRDYYFDDNMEPSNEGFCHCEKSKYYFNNGAGEGVICESYQKILQP